MLLGFDPWDEVGPIRGLMMKNLPILPPVDRPSKNEGSKNPAHDEITLFLKTITQHRNRLILKLQEDKVADVTTSPDVQHPIVTVDLNKLPSNHRHVYWV